MAINKMFNGSWFDDPEDEERKKMMQMLSQRAGTPKRTVADAMMSMPDNADVKSTVIPQYNPGYVGYYDSITKPFSRRLAESEAGQLERKRAREQKRLSFYYRNKE